MAFTSGSVPPYNAPIPGTGAEASRCSSHFCSLLTLPFASTAASMRPLTQAGSGGHWHSPDLQNPEGGDGDIEFIESPLSSAEHVAARGCRRTLGPLGLPSVQSPKYFKGAFSKRFRGDLDWIKGKSFFMMKLVDAPSLETPEV